MFCPRFQFCPAHDGHSAATYEISDSGVDIERHPHLRLRIVDAESEAELAARFSLTVDGRDFVPTQVGVHGLRFTSIHVNKQHRFTATYSRGNGEVLVPLPENALAGTVTATKGFEYQTESVDFVVRGGQATVVVPMRRWSHLHSDGWSTVDEHLHFERHDPAHDDDWLTMLDADGLNRAHFLVLKGGNLPGVWADQHAYGRQGEAARGGQLIIPGEEYRDRHQGHINLLGISKIIQPISTGGMGEPRVDINYPPLVEVFREAHALGGLGGPAHGASFSTNTMALVATILGEVDFFEIANSHLLSTDVWYELMNCGFIVPPVAGTDLPNFGFRDSWQPLLGEVRTYVRAPGVENSGWREALKRGESFVTSGPLLHLQANGVSPGGTLHLPAGGGEVTVRAELACPRPLTELQIVQMGERLELPVERSLQSGIHRMTVTQKLKITQSCWLAARGQGLPKMAIEKGLGIKQNEIAHTGVVQIVVGKEAIRDERAIQLVREKLLRQQEFYGAQGKYENAEQRLEFLRLFDQAIDVLNAR